MCKWNSYRLLVARIGLVVEFVSRLMFGAIENNPNELLGVQLASNLLEQISARRLSAHHDQDTVARTGDEFEIGEREDGRRVYKDDLERLAAPADKLFP